MPVFFTVDRAGMLSEGTTIERVKWDDIESPQLQSHLNNLFPNGFTLHGERYLLKQVLPGSCYLIEVVWEYVRRSHFFACPSRLESVFGFSEQCSAEKFR